MPSNFIYSFTVWFIDSNIGCHCSSLGLCIPVITENVMADTQLGKDMSFWNSSPENINYDMIYVMSFLWSSMDLFDLLCLTQYISYIMATSFSGGRSRSTRREPLTMGKQLVSCITCGCESSAPFL